MIYKKNNKSLNIIFTGTSKFAVQHFNALLHTRYNIIAVLTKHSSISGRNKSSKFSPIKIAALKHSIPVFEPKSLQSINFQNELSKLNANLMLVVSYGLILPKSILNMFTFGCINIHASLLPRWRGPSPIEYSILNGDKITGITTIYMNEKIDSGDIIHSLSCPINTDDTSKKLYSKLSRIGIRSMLISLHNITIGNHTYNKQDHSKITYSKKIKKKEGNLNWNLSAEILDRKIRAFNPWPVAYFSINKIIVKVWKSEILYTNIRHPAGKILTLNKQGLQISTTDNILNILELQFPNRTIINSIDLYNSYRKFFHIGKILK